MAYYADISRYRPVKDWRLVKRNCPFLISKATEGTDYTDPTLDDFIRGCENNEIPYWLYAYLRNGNEPAQAVFLTEVCNSTHYVFNKKNRCTPVMRITADIRRLSGHARPAAHGGNHGMA